MKTVLITGASSGFGKATAELLTKEGFKLILVGRRKERLQELQDSLKTKTYVATVDVTDQEQVAWLFAHLPAEFRDIDVLVNNAGLALGMNPAQESELDDWERMVDVNIKGLLRITRPVLDIMKERGCGHIINIGSVAATVPYKGGNVYGATKAFVRQFSRNLRVDLFGLGIKVTNIEPGAAETEFSSVRFKDEQKAAEYYKDWKALTAKDVASTIVWAINQPAYVNIDNVEITPLDQAPAGMALHKKAIS